MHDPSGDLLMAAPPRSRTPVRRPGAICGAGILLVFLGFAVSVDFPRTAGGFRGDEATYYSLAHSLARDGDFSFQREDLVRVWEEYPAGPEGIFLKRGSDVELRRTTEVPYVQAVRTPVPPSERLFYAKSYIYPLVASPFVRLFGTNGFLILHALLIALNFAAAYAFLVARGSRPWVAAGLAAVFLFASVVPIYFLWLTPELFNFSLVFQAYFLWAYKTAVDPTRLAPAVSRFRRFLIGPSSDYAAAVLLGVATFSKPTHVLLILPILAYAVWRRQWLRTAAIGVLFAVTTAGLFLVNAATSGEFNYQGGDRRSFYGRSGFPFANSWASFDGTGQRVATDAVPTDIIFHRDSLVVLGWNTVYFVAGRSSGLLPYFFPGLVLFALFLRERAHRSPVQWLVAGTIVASALALVLYMPYTFSGGGGPVGNRYFLSFYPLFLFLAPPLRSVVPSVLALGVAAVFIAKVVLNPFYSSFNPGEHLKAGPLRLLPIERTLLNDLPVSANAERARRALDGPEPLAAYFPDENAYTPEEGRFWVRGKQTAEVLLRAPARELAGGRVASLRVRRLDVEVTNGAVSNTVVVAAGLRRVRLDLAPGEVASIDIPPGAAVPYKPSRYPTNYVYRVAISTSDGFVPFLHAPGESSDSRYLGARIRIAPVYFNP
jgi:hypothetical protein